MIKYDYVIVGAGLFGATFAREATRAGKTCLVVEKREHIGGNIFTQNIEGRNTHTYGAHIFHTKDKQLWDYINSFAEFNNYINCPFAFYKNQAYTLPFNMNTFCQLWGALSPDEARRKIAQQVESCGISEPQNLEEQAIKMVGEDIYNKLIKGYTQKQWGKSPKELPAFIIKRLPVRFTFDNNYFNDKYQGIPIGGYTQIISKMLEGSDVLLNVDFLADKERLSSLGKKVLYTGALDRYFDYCYGELEYRSVRFDTQILNTSNFQGNAVINYTDYDIPYTRIIEHKHFEYATTNKTVVSYEYSQNWNKTLEPYYPVNNPQNDALAAKYVQLAASSNILVGGRLATYKYYDMDVTLACALNLAKQEL